MISDEYFRDWLSDNEDELKIEFLETEYDKFMAYCREQFSNEREYQ